ncbi:MAG: hypothetical protein BGO98_17390 [Myxococcales bacterium 68-20]|nr:MAG: hypothetical protein BGO98_17390 [Myxococcales bacterium 68-20]
MESAGTFAGRSMAIGASWFNFTRCSVDAVVRGEETTARGRTPALACALAPLRGGWRRRRLGSAAEEHGVDD